MTNPYRHPISTPVPELQGIASIAAHTPEPAGGSEAAVVREIETVTGDFLTERGAAPFYRIELNGYCADFDHRQAAESFAAQINALVASAQPAGGWQQEQVEAVLEAGRAAVEAIRHYSRDCSEPIANRLQKALAALTQPSGERPEESRAAALEAAAKIAETYISADERDERDNARNATATLIARSIRAAQVQP